MVTRGVLEVGVLVRQGRGICHPSNFGVSHHQVKLSIRVLMPWLVVLTMSSAPTARIGGGGGAGRTRPSTPSTSHLSGWPSPNIFEICPFGAC